MKKTSIVLGFGLFALFISFKGSHHQKLNKEIVSNCSDINSVFEEQLQHQFPTVILKGSDLEILEIEEDFNIGFDTAEYLPLGFNAYAGMELEAQDLEVFESEEEVDLGFDTAAYLPDGFNAYAQ